MRPSLMARARPVAARVRGLFRSPRREVARAATEPGDVRSLLAYVLPLAVVGPIAIFLSEGVIGTYTAPQAVLFGMRVGGGFIRAPVTALVAASTALALEVGGWWLLAWLLAKLAPQFDGRADAAGARKLAALVATPVWLAGATALFASVPYFAFVEPLAYVAALAYAVLLGVRALPLLFGTPEAKAAGHVIAAAGISFVAVAVLWRLLLALLV
jgi:hypothetical protein